MNLKRAIGISVVVYLATFLIGLAVAAAMQVREANPASQPAGLWIIGVVSSVILATLGAWWYFRSPTTTRSVKEGFYVGLTMVVTGFVLDAITIGLASAGAEQPLALLLDYYSQVYFWITVALIVVATSAVGSLNRPTDTDSLNESATSLK